MGPEHREITQMGPVLPKWALSANYTIDNYYRCRPCCYYVAIAVVSTTLLLLLLVLRCYCCISTLLRSLRCCRCVAVAVLLSLRCCYILYYRCITYVVVIIAVSLTLLLRFYI